MPRAIDRLGNRPLHRRFPVSVGAALAVVVRPRLWATALGAANSLAPEGWWRERPHLPLPDPDWLHFRLVTAYGGDGAQPMGAEELVTWLEWTRDIQLGN